MPGARQGGSGTPADLWRRIAVVADALSVVSDAEALLRKLLQTIVELLRCERGFIGLGENGEPGLRAIECERVGQSPRIFERVASAPLLETILARREAVITQVPGGERTGGCAMGVPLQSGSRLLGLIYVEDQDRTESFAPGDLEVLRAFASLAALAIESAERLHCTALGAEALRESTDELIGESEPMRELKARMKKYAAVDTNVLIRGETGTGKELVARTLHALSARADRPFVTVNCAALPESMIESELFGYEKGAFTGAIRSRRGKFALAHGATLFLDEIGDLSLAAQAKVLRAIEDGEIQPLGSEKTIRLRVRIISATHKNLAREVVERRFREDLFYRLNTLELQLSPLRARGDDVVLLARAFLARVGARLGKRGLALDDSAARLIRSYHWPGNIRELRNDIERAAILAEREIISEQDLSPRLAQASASTAEPSAPRSLSEQFAQLSQTEQALVRGALARSGGNVSQAARLLGITRIMMQRRLERLRSLENKEQNVCS